MLCRLHIMMSTKTWASFVLSFILFLYGCGDKQQPSTSTCRIDGIIDSGSTAWDHSNGIKVTIESVSDKSLKFIAVTDNNGNFQFRDIEAGKYLISAEKEGYVARWMLDDGVLKGINNSWIIEVFPNKIKNIEIHIDKKTSGQGSDSDALDVTDMNGNPISVIKIPRNASMISIKLFNGTQSDQHWDISGYDKCFVSANFELEYVFTSFNITQGVLKTGDNVVIVGYINPNIFKPQFESINGVIYLSNYGSIKNMFRTFDVCFAD